MLTEDDKTVYNSSAQALSLVPLSSSAARLAGGRFTVNRLNLDPRLLFALVPLVLLDLGMVVYSIVDLYQPDRRVRGGNKLLWLLVILLVSTLGWLVYLLVGREE
jgi:Phospholipase_D-nuclease N-terminal